MSVHQFRYESIRVAPFDQLLKHQLLKHQLLKHQLSALKHQLTKTAVPNLLPAGIFVPAKAL
jgi:hypothetical protein